MSQPTLPQGAGYGVGALPLPHRFPFVTEYMSREQSLVCLIHVFLFVYSSLKVAEPRHRSFLQRVYDRVDRRPNTLHWLLPKERRRVQQCVQERQARAYCCRYRLRLDVGRYSGLSTPIPVTFFAHQFCAKLQSSAVAYKYGISGPWWYGSGATIQVLLFAQVRIAPFTYLMI